MHGQPNIKVQRFFFSPPDSYRHRIQPNFLAGGLFATLVATWQVLARFLLLVCINPLSSELNPICNLLALLAHDFLHVSRIRVKSLTLRFLMSYIYIYIYIWSTYS
jgi:hypothetical protein